MSTSTRLPRVMLVEDDTSISQFVAMALEDQPLQVLTCATLQSARQTLRLAGDDMALVLLDMMLPDGSGLDLLRDPLRLRPGITARWVVFSAGMPPATRDVLAALDVDDVLDKPVSLDRLLSCVESACNCWILAQGIAADAVAATGETAPRDAPLNAPSDPAGLPVPATGQLLAHEAAAIQTYFFGQDALFKAMKEQTLKRLPDDVQAVERFIGSQDAQQLRRAAHNLKSVTLMLGQIRAADLARALEDAATQTDSRVWQALWNGLRAELELWQAGG